MAKGIYIGDSSYKARKVKKLYIGDASGKARKVKKVYIGDANGKARLAWQSGINKFVVVGGTNARAYSINPSSPTIHTIIPKPSDSLSTNYMHRASTYCLDNFCFAGYFGKVFYSNDGETMYENGSHQPEGGDYSYFIKYINGKIFTGAYATGILRYKNSIESTTWTNISKTFKYILDIAYGNGYYVAIYGNGLYVYYAYSTDLVNWTTKTYTVPSTQSINMANISYYNGLFFVNASYMGSGTITPRTTFTINPSTFSATTSSSYHYKTIEIGGNLYSVGNSILGYIRRYETSNGAWSDVHKFTNANSNQDRNIRFTDLAYGDGVYVAIGHIENASYSYARCIATSTNNMATWNIAYYTDSALTGTSYLNSVSFSADGGTQ